MSTYLTARYFLTRSTLYDTFSGYESGRFSSIQRGGSSIPFATGNSDYINFLGDFGYFINEGGLDNSQTYSYLGIEDYLTNE